MSIKSGQDQVAGANQGLQAAVTGLGKHYGNEIAKQIPVQAQEQKNTQAKLTEQAITAQKEALTKAAAEYLQENNLNVPEGKIKATIEKHSVFKGNAADIEESLISLGTAAHEDNKNRNDAAQAIKRGLSIVLRSTIKQLVLQTAASSTSTNAYQSNRQTQTRKPEQGPLITPNKTTTENKAKLGPRNSESQTELPVNTLLLPFGKPSTLLSPAEKINEDLTKAIANHASNGPRVAQHNPDTPPRHSADDLMAQRRAINQSIHGSHYQEESCLATQFVGTLVGGAEKLASNTVELTKMGGGLLLDGLLEKDYMNVISPQMRQEAHIRNQERGTAILNAFKNIPNAPTLFKQHVEAGLHQASENIAAGNNFTVGKQLGSLGVDVVQGGTAVLGAANLVTKGVQSATQAANNLAKNTTKFIADNEFRSPITYKYEPGRLNSGIPIDLIKPQNPIVPKRNISNKIPNTNNPKDHARNNFNNSNKLNQKSFTPAFEQIESFSANSTFLGGDLYPKEKLSSLIKYLEKRNVHVYGVIDDPCFIARREGVNHMYLSEHPTVLEVKHELSHWLDYKKLGFEEYSKLSRHQRESLVLERLQKNRIWDDLNQLEKEFSVKYVDGILQKAGGPNVHHD